MNKIKKVGHGNIGTGGDERGGLRRRLDDDQGKRRGYRRPRRRGRRCFDRLGFWSSWHGRGHRRGSGLAGGALIGDICRDRSKPNSTNTISRRFNRTSAPSTATISKFNASGRLNTKRAHEQTFKRIQSKKEKRNEKAKYTSDYGGCGGSVDHAHVADRGRSLNRRGKTGNKANTATKIIGADYRDHRSDFRHDQRDFGHSRREYYHDRRDVRHARFEDHRRFEHEHNGRIDQPRPSEQAGDPQRLQRHS